MNILEFQNVSYTYKKGGAPVFSHRSYAFERGKLYAVAGHPGAGKTTLLLLLAGFDDPSEGLILYDGRDLRKIDRAHYRSRSVGTLFSGFSLLPPLTAAENVEQAIELAGIGGNKRRLAAELLDRVGIAPSRADRRASELTEGEKLRVSVARALSYHPGVLLVDEQGDGPDGETMRQMMHIFTELAHEEEMCVILATKSPDAAAAADAVCELPPMLPPQAEG